jgi:GT2 family glycosyltransferase
MPEPEPQTTRSARESERRKWDSYYESLPLHEEDSALRAFNDEFAAYITELLPAGSSVLEAGAGAGWQSIALARTGRFEVSVMDFSPRALDYSRRIFERERLSANFIEGDIRDAGDGAFDLVFNAGVLEHYTFEQQAELIRAMASYSQRFVLTLVPNGLCYWYWLWRIGKAANAEWPFGKEVPLVDLSAVFQAAGLHFVGQAFLGSTWSESFIRDLPGMDSDLAEQILKVHRSPVIPPAQRSYLVAALGSVSTEKSLVARWSPAPSPEDMPTAELRAIAADSLALRLQSEGTALQARLKELEAALSAETQKWTLTLESERKASEALRQRIANGLQAFQSQFQKQLASYRAQRAWRIMLAVRKAYTVLARRKVKATVDPLDRFELDFPNLLNFVPEEVFAPNAAAAKQRLPGPDRKYDIIVLPIFDFDFRFQRPQQIAMQFARSGHRVFWISPARMLPGSSLKTYESIQIRENVWEIHLRAAPFDLYRGALEPLQKTALLDSLGHLYRDMDIAASCAILQFPFWRQIGLGLREAFGARVVYDCMDDWQNWPTEPLPGQFSLAEERKLVGESDVLVVTSRELHARHAASGITSKLIPNAADFDFFRNAPAGSLLSKLPRPVIGYFGAIADWFDLELMTEVIRNRPQYSFALIGQVHLVDISGLKSLSNVYLLGEKNYQELPGYLREFDVCTLPFRMNNLTRAVDPVKVYEYLSQGKAVVSTPLPELNSLSELLYFADGAEEFAQQIDKALEERDPKLVSRRVEFAARNTWAARVKILDEAIRARFPLVSILVVTHNTREYLGPFLDSIRRNTSYPSYEMVVVDNHSTDGSAEALKQYARNDPRIRVECLDRNLGFAGGNNFAARMAKGEYLVLLNPDVIVTAGWLERLLSPVEKDGAIGLVAPITNFSGNETKVNTSYRSLEEMEDFALECGNSNRGKSIDIDVIPLLCGLAPRKVWEEVGELDESFEVGTFEDDDFSLRVRKAGYRIVTAEDCFIHHFGNGSFGKLESEDFNRIFERNKKRFESKWKTTWRPHKTRPGVRPISPDNRIAISDFFRGDAAGGL